RLRLRGQRIASTALLGERIGRHQLAGGELWKPGRLLRLGTEPGDGQGPDADVRSEGDAPAPHAAVGLGQQHRGRLVAAQPAEPLRYVHHQEPQLPGLPEQRAEQARRLSLYRVRLREHLLAEELEAGAKERTLLLGEGLRGGDGRPASLLEEEAASLRNGRGGPGLEGGGHREHLEDTDSGVNTELTEATRPFQPRRTSSSCGGRPRVDQADPLEHRLRRPGPEGGENGGDGPELGAERRNQARI